MFETALYFRYTAKPVESHSNHESMSQGELLCGKRNRQACHVVGVGVGGSISRDLFVLEPKLAERQEDRKDENGR